MSRAGGPWRRYVALGDSFTEGMSDPGPDGPDTYRGWADRLAELLDAAQQAAGAPPLEYANLAVRGRLQRQILDEQLPTALQLQPDLVSLSAGGNDLLRRRPDLTAIAERTEAAVAALRAGGSDVLLVTGVDPSAAPLLRLTRHRVADHNQRLWAIAQRHGAVVLDLWGLRALQDGRMWAADRLHLSSEGHRRVALLAATTLTSGSAVPVGGSATTLMSGSAVPVGGSATTLTSGSATGDTPEWAQPLEPLPRSWGAAVRASRDDAAWARQHLAPWVRRRLEGRSSGDGRQAKRPLPTPVATTRRPLRDTDAPWPTTPTDQGLL